MHLHHCAVVFVRLRSHGTRSENKAKLKYWFKPVCVFRFFVVFHFTPESNGSINAVVASATSSFREVVTQGEDRGIVNPSTLYAGRTAHAFDYKIATKTAQAIGRYYSQTSKRKILPVLLIDL